MNGENGSNSVEAPAEDDLLAGMITGDVLDQRVFPPVAWHVPGVIPEGFSLLVAAPKAGKSWLVLACGLAVATGGRALGALEVDERPVLYLALEDGERRLQERCRSLLYDAPIPPGVAFLTRTVRPGSTLATIEAYLERYGHDRPLIVLDTLGKVMPPALPGESSYSRDYRIGGALKRLVDDVPGSGLTVVHHDRKAASEDFVDSVSGTHGLAGSADTVIILGRDRNTSDGRLKVTGRDVPEGEYGMTLHGNGSWHLVGGDLQAAADAAVQSRVTAGVGDRLAEVIAFVGSNRGGVRAGDVAEKLGMNPDQARVYLSRAFDAGRLSKPARGLYTPVTSVSSVTSGRFPIQNETQVTEVTPLHPCSVCGQPMTADEPGQTTHEECEPAPVTS